MFNLAADDVTKTYREGRETVDVLKGASLHLAAGEVVVLEGPSGSGKTTLLSILGCLLSATSGRIAVAGEVVDATKPAKLQAVRRKHIGFVFQQFNLFPALRALENVEYALNLKGVVGDEATRQARELIQRVGLADRAEFLPRDLSGGQKQRVAIARALGARPSVVLADEPTANLDTGVAAQILDLFRDLAQSEGSSLLIVTHDPKVRRIADRVVCIEDGRIAA
jgi:putative ABC transport system ATP-binding protein